MKKFIEEFKEFAIKGNMIDMAIGVIIGAAFKGVVDSFMSSIVNPLIGLISGRVDLNDSLKWVIVPEVKSVVDGVETVTTEEVAVTFGAFISTLLNFLIMAMIVFMFVKALGKLRAAEAEVKKARQPKEEPKKPTTKICPYCRSEIAIEATRCPHCTSQLENTK